MNHESAYGLWSLVIINSLVFIIFAFSFTKPKSRGDWRSLGVFSAFIVALFTEMYGFPLTIFLLSGWLSSRFPGIDPFSHEAGHLWATIFGIQGNPHFGFLHVLSNVMIISGFWLLASAWTVLHQAQKEQRLATSGLYSYIRHPQYLGFLIIMTGFLFQWPTIPTLVMFPVMVWIYARLARTEERQAISQFGQSYNEYKSRVPAFLPRFKSKTMTAKNIEQSHLGDRQYNQALGGFRKGEGK